MKTPNLIIASVVSALSLVASLQADQVIYREDFLNSDPYNRNMAVNSVGWSFYIGSSATNGSAAIPATGDYAAIAAAAGNPNTSKGAFFAQKRDSGVRNFAAVDTFSSSLNLQNGADISWTMGNSLTAISVSLMIQIGGNGTTGSGQWYVSSAQWSNATSFGSLSAFSAAPTESVTFGMDFSTAASAWREFTLLPDQSMQIGQTLATDLGNGSVAISGIGFYMTTPESVGIIRLDTLEIVAPVPEPALAAVLLMGSAALLVACRRKTR